MISFLSDYKSLSKNGGVSYRVDKKNKRVYLDKKYIGKKIDISKNGDIIEVDKNAGGVIVNNQSFISVAKMSNEDIEKMASVINK